MQTSPHFHLKRSNDGSSFICKVYSMKRSGMVPNTRLMEKMVQGNSREDAWSRPLPVASYGVSAAYISGILAHIQTISTPLKSPDQAPLRLRPLVTI